MKKLFLVPLVFVPALVNAEAKPAAPLPNGPPSKAVTTDILDAIAEEMNRAMTSLEIPNAPKPYHIAYKITEVDVNDVAASLGQTTSKRNRHFVNLEARVRVGSAQFDNTNFVVPQADELDGVVALNLPLEATPHAPNRAALSGNPGRLRLELEPVLDACQRLRHRRPRRARHREVVRRESRGPVRVERPTTRDLALQAAKDVPPRDRPS